MWKSFENLCLEHLFPWFIYLSIFIMLLRICGWVTNWFMMTLPNFLWWMELPLLFISLVLSLVGTQKLWNYYFKK